MPLTLDSEIHVGDIGTELVVEVTDEDGAAVNIAAATSKLIYLTRPLAAGGVETLTKTAALDTDGTDGLMKYVTVAGDLSIKGNWKIQGWVAVGGAEWSTRETNFRVLASRRG